MGQLFSKSPVFHDVCGDGIEISEDKLTARCVTTAKNNSVFSLYPVKSKQKIYVKLITISDRSHDVISVGFTSNSPSNRNLPKYDEDKSDCRTCSLSRYYFVENAVFFFNYDESGYIQFGQAHKETRTSNVKIQTDKPLWAVMHIWHAPTAIKLTTAAVSPAEETPAISPFAVSDERVARRDASVSTQNEDNSLCAICYENVTGAALYPCGHLCMCYQCAMRQWRGEGDGNCPICRKEILDVLKIYK